MTKKPFLFALCLCAMSTAFAMPQDKADEIIDAYNKARQTKDWPAALKAADEFAKLGPNEAVMARQMRFSVHLRAEDARGVQTYYRALATDNGKVLEGHFNAITPEGKDTILKSFDTYEKMLERQLTDAKLQKLRLYVPANDPAGFETYAKELIEKNAGDPEILNGVAWRIAGPDLETFNGVLPYSGMIKQDAQFRTPALLAIAKTASEKVVQLNERKNGGYLDTLAWVQFRLGNKQEAAKTELEASTKIGPLQKDFYVAVSKWFGESK